MIGSIPTTLVTRTAPSARVQRRRIATDGGEEETGSVEAADTAPRLRVGPAVSGFETEAASTPRPAMRTVTAAALAAILKLQRGG